jgi:anti-anti-sigma factor
VLAYGTLAGVAIAVLLATLNVFRRAALPQIVELGRVPGTTHFANLERWTDAARVEGVAVLRFSGALFFANAGALRDRILEIVRGRPGLHAVVVDIRAISDIDITAVEVLATLVGRLDAAGVALMLVRPSKAVRASSSLAGSARASSRRPWPIPAWPRIEHLGLDLDRLADVAEAMPATPCNAEAAPIRSGTTPSRSTVARAAVALGGFAPSWRPAPSSRPTPTNTRRHGRRRSRRPQRHRALEVRAEAVVTGPGWSSAIPSRSGCRIERRHVVAQDPARARRSMRIDAGRHGLDQRQLVVVPVSSASQPAALVELSQVGLRLTGVEEVPAPGVPAGQVLASKPGAGTTVAEGSGVDARRSRP